ncbi:MAG: DUF6460 domain-containing protein [Pseudomonadota bacterium]
MVLKTITSALKIALASLLVGLVLHFLDITADDVLGAAGITPADLQAMIRKSIQWAVPHIMLGALFTIPVWLIIYMFRPPRG